MEKMKIRANVVKNRLYIMLAGFFNDKEMKEAADKIIQEIGRLKPGFSIINDVAEFKPATPQGAEEMKRTQEAAKAAGAGRIIRVVGSMRLAHMQLARKAKEVGYEAELAASTEEAEQMLDEG